MTEKVTVRARTKDAAERRAKRLHVRMHGKVPDVVKLKKIDERTWEARFGGERPKFECEVCGKEYLTETGLKNHMKKQH